MLRRLSPLVIFIVSVALSSNAWAWLNTGHRIVAYVAWEDLTPSTRAKVCEILKLHPRYVKDLLAEEPEGMGDEASDRYAFASAATWPDMVRSFSNPMHAAYNHPSWHYIDIPYAIDGQAVPAAGDAPVSGPRNVVEALAKNVADLKDPNVSGANKAVALCWILHLCGDIHQPLHACSLFSPQFPHGDQGGNAIIVLRDPPYPDSRSKLHLVWDSLPGDFETRDIEEYIASGLRNDPRYTRARLAAQLNVKDFAAWANESYQLAIKYAYLNGKLKGATASTRPTDALETAIPGLPPGYLAKAEEIGDQRLILAGYRTADLLNSIFANQ